MRKRRRHPDWVPEAERTTVRVKPHSYQPSKADLEEEVMPLNPDGSRATVEDALRAVLRPVHVVEDVDA